MTTAIEEIITKFQECLELLKKYEESLSAPPSIPHVGDVVCYNGARRGGNPPCDGSIGIVRDNGFLAGFDTDESDDEDDGIPSIRVEFPPEVYASKTYWCAIEDCTVMLRAPRLTVERVALGDLVRVGAYFGVVVDTSNLDSILVKFATEREPSLCRAQNCKIVMKYK